MGKSTFSIGKLLLTLFVAVFTIAMGTAAIGSSEDIGWYKDALNNAKASIAGDQTVPINKAPGHSKIQNAAPFDKDCYVNEVYGYGNSSEWLAAAKALYDATGLQLYRVTLGGETGAGTSVQTTADAKDICMDYINKLPSLDTAIILYDFTSTSDYDNWVSIYETLYYGDAAMEYLSPADLDMIQYVVEHDYDFFNDYNSRTVRVWELISSNLANGYNRNEFNGSVRTMTDWDVDYYRSQMNEAIVATCIFAGLCFIGLAGFATLFYVNFILHPRKIQSAIEINEAIADKIILEADVKKMPEKADKLVDKYLNK